MPATTVERAFDRSFEVVLEGHGDTGFGVVNETNEPRITIVVAEDHPVVAELSPREVEVLQWVAAGKGNKEIAAQLFIAEGTVKTHVKNLLEKLSAVGRAAAVREAVHRGLVRLS